MRAARRVWRWTVLGVVLRLGMPSGAIAEEPPVSFAAAIHRVEGAVVRILAPLSPDDPGEPGTVQEAMRRYAFDDGTGTRVLGTGLMVSPDGEVVTSRHVVEGIDRVRVRLVTDEELPATVVGSDDVSDLALLRVTASRPLIAASIDELSDVVAGDWVAVLGNGPGPLPAASAGIVGAKGRVLGIGPGHDLMQLDMGLLPVAAGGPIVDRRGIVVGLASVLAEPAAGTPGIGFAVPVELVKWFVGQIHEHGHVVRGWLGLTVQPVTPDLASALRLPQAQGALVADVAPGSPAARAGIRRGDVVVRVGERQIQRARELPALIANLPPESNVQVGAIRNGRERTFDTTLREEPAATLMGGSRAPARSGGVEADWGLNLRPATADESKRLGLQPKHGVVITDVDEDSAAEDAGLEIGDVIVSANKQPVRSLADLRKLLGPTAAHVLLVVRRDTASLFVELDR